MTGREFAEKYAGHRVRVIGHDVPDRSANETPYARIVGYDETDGAHTFVVEFDDEHDRALSWGIHNRIRLVVPIESFNGPPVLWTTGIDDVQLLTGKKRVNAKKPSPVVKPYPNLCKSCGSPARKACEVVICSNAHCKSRKGLYAISKKIPNKTRIIRCLQCNSKAVNCRKEYGENQRSTVYRATCLNGHKWTHELQINDVLSSSLVNPGDVDRIWIPSAGGWQHY